MCVIGGYFVRGILCDYYYCDKTCTYTSIPKNIPVNESNVRICYCPFIGITPGSFDYLTNLESLTLNDMPTLKNFPNLTGVAETLQLVQLYNNDIRYINTSYINALINVVLISLTGNKKLNYLPNLHGLSKLEQIYLLNTGISSLPDFNEIAPSLNIVILNFANGIMQYASPANSAALFKLKVLNLNHLTNLEFLPTTCPRHRNIRLDGIGSGLKWCDCRHAWIKEAAEEGAVVNMDYTECKGKVWSSISTAEFIDVCHVKKTSGTLHY